MKKGRADLQWFKAGKLYLFEFKVGTDVQKTHQKAFQEANEQEGAKYFIIRSQEEYEREVNTIHLFLDLVFNDNEPFN